MVRGGGRNDRPIVTLHRVACSMVQPAMPPAWLAIPPATGGTYYGRQDVPARTPLRTPIGGRLPAVLLAHSRRVYSARHAPWGRIGPGGSPRLQNECAR